uniref:Sulfotransferase n=1 Tax=Neolamprologus brichardi TaxID=32507 RepID=A0A3Q4GXT6_NEOBR
MGICHGWSGCGGAQGVHTLVLMPPGLMDKKGKIVYLMRNPKDNMTSYYHFSKTLAGLETPQSFAQFFEWYLTGNGTLNLEICHHFSDFYSLKIHIRQMQLRYNHGYF